ncbi:Carbamate kinase 1 [Candidatus Hepatincola sp. Pdp]
MKKVIVALGGNALENNAEPTAENQLKVIKSSVKNIADLIEAGYSVTLTHGNGPQVGRIALQNEAAKAITPILPFDVCGAMSQGMIGYHIQQALGEELLLRKIKMPVVSIITQVLVDKNDSAFKNPTKPIGPFYSAKEAKELAATKGYSIKEDSGRGFRRVVASPKPLRIIELEAIKNLINNKFIVITVGGGGIPVIAKGDSQLVGVAAVIDKDFASAKLAEDIGADLLIILTAVDKVALNFGKANQSFLDKVTMKDIEKYIAEGHFAAGSMLPKIQASLNFVKSKPNRKALITSLEKVKDALNNKNGTYIME